MERFEENFIGGRWLPSAGDFNIRIADPCTERENTQIAAARDAEVDSAIRSASEALADWSRSSIAQRRDLLVAIAKRLESRTQEVAAALALDIGCPLWFTKEVQVPLPVRNLQAIAEGLDQIAFEERIGHSKIVREPIGVVAAITPWNAPIHQMVAKIGAAIAAGCTIVVKPSENASRAAVLLMQIIDQCGVPPGVVNMVFGDAGTAKRLVEHPRINMVSFTGSTEVGRSVAAHAGAAIKKIALELGGKSAAIVLPGASIEDAVANAAKLTFGNSGQICVAQSRLLVHRANKKAAEEICRAEAARWTIGLPTDPDTKMGPLATARGRARMKEIVESASAAGARIVAGAAPNSHSSTPGYFVQPTVLSDAAETNVAVQEEIFGPVLTIQSYESEDEAVHLANATPYGLSGAIWAPTAAEGERVARRLRTGQVSINGARSNMAAPFGGFGMSGIGRENGRFGIEEMLQYKTLNGV